MDVMEVCFDGALVEEFLAGFNGAGDPDALVFPKGGALTRHSASVCRSGQAGGDVARVACHCLGFHGIGGQANALEQAC
jgi:hypothetical protein